MTNLIVKIKKFFSTLWWKFLGYGEPCTIKNIPRKAIFEGESFISISFEGYSIPSEKPREFLFVPKYIGFEDKEDIKNSGKNFIAWGRNSLKFNIDKDQDKAIKNRMQGGRLIVDIATKFRILETIKSYREVIIKKYDDNILGIKQNYYFLLGVLATILFSSPFVFVFDIISPIPYLFMLVIDIVIIIIILMTIQYHYQVTHLEHTLREAIGYTLSYDLSDVLSCEKKMLLIEWKDELPTYHFILPFKDFEDYYNKLLGRDKREEVL